MVAWLARQGQVPTAELAARFGIGVEEVVRELELAACCGVPPYSPDTLLEIVVTGDTVEAFLPPEMARPRRLTPAEGFALAAAARTILAVPGADREGALAGALAKLDRALGGHQGLVVTLDRPPLLDAVRRAAEEGTRLELEYHSVSTDQTTLRAVDPGEVLSLDGHWYLDAYCHRAGDRRRFRVDRILSLRVTDPAEGEDRGAGAAGVPGAPGGPRGAQAFVPGPGAVEVRLALDPGAWWLADSVPVLRAEPNGGGGGQVVLAVGGLAWLERILLQAGAGARVLAPPELIGAGPAAARRVLARYRASDSMESHEKDGK